MNKNIFLVDNMKGGGAEKAIKIIVEELSKNFPQKFQLVLLEEKYDYQLSDHVNCISLSKTLKWWNFALIILRYVKLLRTKKVSMQFGTNTKSHVVSIAAKIFTGTKTCINLQNNIASAYRYRPVLLKTIMLLYKFADCISFISKGIELELNNQLPHKDRFIIPNPIDFDEIDAKKIRNIPKNEKAIFDKPVIITVGSLSEQKSQHVLLEAFSRLDIDCNLVILGVGPLKNKLEHLADSMNIRHRVFFLGFKQNPFKYLSRATLFVLSSSWEGFGNVIVEAMACGLPVISTDCPCGPREILAPDKCANSYAMTGINREKYGYLVPVNDPLLLRSAMNEMMNREDIRKQYIDRGFNHIVRFNKKAIASDYAMRIFGMPSSNCNGSH